MLPWLLYSLLHLEATLGGHGYSIADCLPAPYPTWVFRNIDMFIVLTYVFPCNFLGPDILTMIVGSDISRYPNTPKPTCRGYLHKRTQSAILKGWRKRWFVLKHNGYLHYYKHKKVRRMAGEEPIKMCPELWSAAVLYSNLQIIILTYGIYSVTSMLQVFTGGV